MIINLMNERINLTLLIGMTRNGPPDPLQIIAINLELQAQNNESHVISVMRTSDMHCSCFTGLQKTCRNLLCRTILLILLCYLSPPSRADSDSSSNFEIKL